MWYWQGCEPSTYIITPPHCQVLHRQRANDVGHSIGPTTALESQTKPLHDGINLRVVRCEFVGLIG